jgi:hypothetical protein
MVVAFTYPDLVGLWKKMVKKQGNRKLQIIYIHLTPLSIQSVINFLTVLGTA